MQVNLATTGDSIAATAYSNIFEYAVSVSSIYPQTGSINGGTLLTITGVNFVNDTTQTNVYIGIILDWFCNIESITPTTIQCRTPAISPYYAPGQSQTVTVSTRLVVLANCLGNCTFSYLDNATSPSLTSISSATVGGGFNLSLTGSLFPRADGTCQVSLTNSLTSTITVLSTNFCSNNSANLIIPKTLISGNYVIRVRNDIG